MSDETTPREATRPRRRAAAASLEATSAGPATIALEGTSIEAEHLAIHQGAVARAVASELTVVQGAVGLVRADRITADRSAIGGALAGELHLSRSYGRTILAREASVDRSAIRTLIAADVRIERPSLIGIVVARRLAGDVRVLLDWRGALAFGAAAGIAAGLVRRARGGRR